MIRFETSDHATKCVPEHRIDSISRAPLELQVKSPWHPWRIRLVDGTEFASHEPTKITTVPAPEGFALLVPVRGDSPDRVEWKLLPILAWKIEVTLFSNEPVLTEPIHDGICAVPIYDGWSPIVVDRNTQRARSLADGGLIFTWRHEITEVMAEALRISKRCFDVSDGDLWDQMHLGNPVHMLTPL